MELEFIQNETGKWVSEFQVTSDFNLHLDNVNKRSLKVLQRTNGEKYSIIADTLEVRDYTNVFDCDFAGLVYPKFIKIESGVKPIGVITTDGEVTEIKSQSKDVEITANGKVDVAPDAGYAYLSKVSVNVNVPQSGGGESGGGTMTYYRTKDADFLMPLMAVFGKFQHEGTAFIGPMPLVEILQKQHPDVAVEAFGVLLDETVIVTSNGETHILTCREYLEQQGINVDSTPTITKEEFYNLES